MHVTSFWFPNCFISYLFSKIHGLVGTLEDTIGVTVLRSHKTITEPEFLSKPIQIHLCLIGYSSVKLN